MKIAYINADPDVPVFGTQGSSVHVQEMVLAMLKRGAEVHLFTSRLGEDIAHDVTALQVHPLPRLTSKDAVSREESALTLNITLRNALAREAQKGKFDLVYERHSLWSCGAMEFAREQQISSVLEVNAPLIEEGWSQRTLINRAAAEDVAARAFRSASVIAAVSRQLANLIEQHPAARGRVRIVPNAVNLERFCDIQPTLVRDRGFVVGFVGSLRSIQGFTSLIECFTRLAQQSAAARLLIVGDGPGREHLQREFGARDLLARIHFAGSVPPEAVPGYLASMDVAVAPYAPQANFYSSPLKIYEYMAAGLPIIASRIGQIEEVLQHEVTGLLVPPGDFTAFARALTDLQMNPELRQRLGSAAREAVQEHTWDHILEHVFSLAGIETVADPVS